MTDERELWTKVWRLLLAIVYLVEEYLNIQPRTRELRKEAKR